MGLFDTLFDSYSDRGIKKIQPLVKKVISLDREMQDLTDDRLETKTEEFKKRAQKDGEDLDHILPEAFTMVQEAAWRVSGMKHSEVRIIGGITLHQGRIAKVKTGEGKTLAATLPVYLNTLEGRGVHVVTVNDYLASQDQGWMGKIYKFLGLSAGCILRDITPEERRVACNADITYGTNDESGFDYLRDNTVIYREEMVQRDLHYCIVGEVDSTLIDEARTPLIILGQGDESANLYIRVKDFANTLTSRVKSQGKERTDIFNREFTEETMDHVINEKQGTSTLTDKETIKTESCFGVDNLSGMENMELAHHINQALKAQGSMKGDIDYVVQKNEIIIVDEFTGHLMYGHHYSDELHQATKAKEAIEVKTESKTLVIITFQSFFRMYDKLVGMTGAARAKEEKFREIYKIDVIEIPTNKPVIRKDMNDVIYKDERSKFQTITEETVKRHETGQPILIGTISIEKSELLGKYLKRRGIKHQVLNAKRHKQESEAVAQAGRYGAITVATNMAGRGTDIVLGGSPEFMAEKGLLKQSISEATLELVNSFFDAEDQEVIEARKLYREELARFEEGADEEEEKVTQAGGLHIIGTERHGSRWIDNQLRGQADRQGDPGSTRFYISEDDDLIRLFAGDRSKKVMASIGTPPDEPIEYKILTRLIEPAQREVERSNFSIRKSVPQCDDVMNKQRQIIYGERCKVLGGQNLRDNILNMVTSFVDSLVDFYDKPDGRGHENLDRQGLLSSLIETFGLEESELTGHEEDSIQDLKEAIRQKTFDRYQAKEREFGFGKFREVERVVLLQVVDQKWMDHIDTMGQLRQGISLRAMGQVNLARAYQNKDFDMFGAMNKTIREDTVKMLFHAYNPKNIHWVRVAKEVETVDPDDGKQKPYVRKNEETDQDDPCPCRSGKKCKNCHGKNA